MIKSRPLVAFQFRDVKQQRETSTLGMWAFLVSEVMFFGSLFAAYTVYRLSYPAAFALASSHTDVFLGSLNTGVLLTSSLVMAFAVLAAKRGDQKRVAVLLALTALLGVAFLGIKGYEYSKDWRDHLVPGASFSLDTSRVPQDSGLVIADRTVTPGFSPRDVSDDALPSEIPGATSAQLDITVRQQAQLFFVLYFFMTGLHALHLTIGVCWTSAMSYFSWRDRFPTGQPVEVLGLYWHFVDIVWIFLYPLIYLAGRGS